MSLPGGPQGQEMEVNRFPAGMTVYYPALIIVSLWLYHDVKVLDHFLTSPHNDDENGVGFNVPEQELHQPPPYQP